MYFINIFDRSISFYKDVNFPLKTQCGLFMRLSYCCFTIRAKTLTKSSCSSHPYTNIQYGKIRTFIRFSKLTKSQHLQKQLAKDILQNISFEQFLKLLYLAKNKFQQFFRVFSLVCQFVSTCTCLACVFVLVHFQVQVAGQFSEFCGEPFGLQNGYH